MSWSHIKIDLPKPPRKLTRLIIRTVDTQEVEHISKGDVIIYGQVMTGKKPTTILPLQDIKALTFTITPVFFNVGINEKATLADKLGLNGPQEKNNSDNFRQAWT